MKLRIMAMDYGEKRIGVALSDPLGIVAQPLKTINIKTQKNIIAMLKALILENQVGLLIVGNPLDRDGRPTPMSRKINEFVNALKKECVIEIKFWDERYTSRLAEKSMRDHGLKPKKKDIDSIAASIILSEFLATKST
jgi:putative Holliday junction resolvase